MVLLDFLRYLQGTVQFEASGAFPERFVNLAARERIPLWDCRKRGGVLHASARAGDYRRLRPLAKKAQLKLRVQKKSGVPFTRRRYRGRWGLPAGLLLFMAFVFSMSLFVWRIEVNGAESVPPSRVLSALEELGVRPGAFRAGIDVRDCERRALLKVPELAWIAINIDGSTATIEISERSLPPNVVDEHAPCNVVAAKSGQIVSMNIYEGQAMVKLGQAVMKGDILISGITQDKLGKNLFRHARGEIMARLEEEISFEVSLDQIRYVETGEIKDRRYLDAFGVDFPLFWPSPLEGFYHVERSEDYLRLFGLPTPLKLYTQRHHMMREEQVRLTEVQARDLALRELRAIEAVKLQGARILERQVTAGLADNAFGLKANYVCIMDIAEPREILVGDGG